MQLTLKRARERRRLTFSQLAAKTGLHKSTVARIERGEVDPQYSTVARLEDALELKRGSLVFTSSVREAVA